MASRRALSLSSTLRRYNHHTFHRRTTTASAAAAVSSLLSSSSPQNPSTRSQNPSRSFHSTPSSLLSARPLNDGDKIDPDTILFEGCDYKHWLIVMDYPNDPQQRPPPEEMVETYVQTLAKVVGSVEEAKKKMYACSTTTYTGFQAEIDEETSQKFEGMPNVLFVLPDSYIDPVNKEYGGDKYINGTIIHRPPPVQYGRVRRGNRFNDQRPRGPMPDQPGNPAYNQHPGDGRGNTPQQSSGQQQGFPPQQGSPPQQGFPPQHGYPQQQGFPRQQGYPPQQGQQSYAQQQGQQSYAQQQGFPPQQGQQSYAQQQGFPPQQGQQSYAQQQGFPPRQGQQGHPQQQGFSSQQGFPPPQGFPPQQRIPAQQNYGPSGQSERVNTRPSVTNIPGGGRDGYQGGRSNYMPSHPGNQNNEFNQPPRQMGIHHQDQRGYGPQGQMGVAGPNMNYNTPPPARGAYGQTGVGTFDQGGPGPNGAGAADGQNQRYTQIPGENDNTIPEEHRSYSPTGHAGMNQGRN